MKRLVEKDIQFLYSESQQDKLVTGKMVLNIQDFEISSFSMDTRKSFQNIILEFKEKGVEFISIRSKQNFNVSRIFKSI